MKEQSVRVGFRARGAFLKQLQEVQEMMSLNTPSEAVQYLTQRGLETLSGPLSVRKLVRKFEGLANIEEFLPLIQAMDKGTLPTIKPAEKIQ